jgi:hypothetical protein
VHGRCPPFPLDQALVVLAGGDAGSLLYCSAVQPLPRLACRFGAGGQIDTVHQLVLGAPGWVMRTSVMIAEIQRSPSARATAMR